MKSNKINWRVNEQITSPQLRVIGEDAKQIGVLAKAEALKKAKELGLDLVEIAPTAKPPVAKIIAFSKFRYQQEKKEKADAKKVKGGELKEIRLSPFIAQGDYNTRIARIREFLDERNKVRVVVVFMGRQMGSKNFGYALLKRVIADLGPETISLDVEPKFIGRHLGMVISPLNRVRKVETPVVAKETEEKRDKNGK